MGLTKGQQEICTDTSVGRSSTSPPHEVGTQQHAEQIKLGNVIASADRRATPHSPE